MWMYNYNCELQLRQIDVTTETHLIAVKTLETLWLNWGVSNLNSEDRLCHKFMFWLTWSAADTTDIEML